ncbi:phosphoglycolate/pyridoxal phosphate phosphatase family protein [Dictyocaulus viviparus]|uniref:Phosphoglycolate/pyridoxal phosphate phosphatase family protein n=1 Tax=Dictyocaulus viviparus TaxID=29172 RepID=A0A0D8Y693_DICVI|nr:phosphoglycolate/pyridoxal phosphate phosphatase family protein [Dictyocaulus viviparus]
MTKPHCATVCNNLIDSHVRELKRECISRELISHLFPGSFRRLLCEIDTFIFDGDGVLWLGDNVIPGSLLLIDFLIKNNKQVIILTNNATKSCALHAKKLSELGFNSKMNEDTIVSPAVVVADMLYEAGIIGDRKVYLIGSQGVRDEMDKVGVNYFGHGPDPQDNSDDSAFVFDIDYEVDPSEVGAVVVGYEKHFNYHKLMMVTNYLQQPDCLFVATNEDEACPGPNPHIITPDAGPLVAAVKCASGREPITVGKPNKPAFDYIKKHWDIIPERTMMIGDRLDTDIKFGRDHGMKTLLVLSGCHKLQDVLTNHANGDLDMVPGYYASSLGALLETRDKA